MTAYVVSFSWLCVRCLRHGVVGSGWGVVAGGSCFCGGWDEGPWGSAVCIFSGWGVVGGSCGSYGSILTWG